MRRPLTEASKSAFEGKDWTIEVSFEENDWFIAASKSPFVGNDLLEAV